MVSIGEKAPNFGLLDQNNTTVSLSEYRGKRVVLAFFPAAFTGVCTEEMCQFEQAPLNWGDSGVSILAICSDSRFANSAFAEKNGITFPILSDYTRSTIESYGVALHDFAGMPGYTASERAVFIVDEVGKIMWKWVGENPGVQPDYEQVISIASQET